MTITREQLEEKYKGLPQDVKDVVFSADVEDEVGQIGKKYELHIDQMGELMEEVELVMLGITHYSNFIPNIGERLGISDKEKIRNIADEVNEKLFRRRCDYLPSPLPAERIFPGPLWRRLRFGIPGKQAEDWAGAPIHRTGTPLVYWRLCVLRPGDPVQIF